MLVLRRKVDESIRIDGLIRVRVLGIEGGRVKIGIDAPPEVNIVRAELLVASTPDAAPLSDAPIPSRSADTDRKPPCHQARRR